jgi:hypothetical protein
MSPPRKAADEPEGLFKDLAPSFQLPPPEPESEFKQPATPPEIMGKTWEEGLFKELAPSFQRPREPISPRRKAANKAEDAASPPPPPPPAGGAGAGAGVGGGNTSLHHSLLGPSLMKAGQEGVDQQKVGEIIYAASVGSKFFENEERRDEAVCFISNSRSKDTPLGDLINSYSALKYP